MNSFIIWSLQQVKKKNNKTGNRLLQISDLIDWCPIRGRLDEMYKNKSEKGGRPNSDVIIMFKILILQQWFGLSDLEVERQISDRLSFMEFLGYPEPFPDSSTIWLFRERMAKTEKDEIVWAELQSQLDAMGLEVSLTSVSESLDEVETSKGERSKMLHSLKRILVPPRNRAAVRLKPVAVEMAHGLRKERKHISAISYIRKTISIMV